MIRIIGGAFYVEQWRPLQCMLSNSQSADTVEAVQSRYTRFRSDDLGDVGNCVLAIPICYHATFRLCKEFVVMAGIVDCRDWVGSLVGNKVLQCNVEYNTDRYFFCLVTPLTTTGQSIQASVLDF